MFSTHTVKLRYDRLINNLSSIIAYASSRSCHFSVQNVTVSTGTYLDITYPRLLRTDFWGQDLQRTAASRYVHLPAITPTSQLTSDNNVLAIGATL